MKNITFALGTTAIFTLLAAYGCGGGEGGSSSGSGDDDASVSSSSSSGGEDPSSSSSSGDVSSSSSGGQQTSSSSSSGATSSSSSGAPVTDGGPDAEVPDACTTITATGWVNSNLCGVGGSDPCPSVFESEFTPVFANTFIDFVRFVFDAESTELNTDYSFSLDPAVWQRDLAGVVGNSPADARYFKADSGTLRVSAFDAATGSATVALTDVKLVEVTYGDDGVANPVAGGTCLRLTSNVNVQNPQ